MEPSVEPVAFAYELLIVVVRERGGKKLSLMTKWNINRKRRERIYNSDRIPIGSP
jgi:hypothetical protein